MDPQLKKLKAAQNKLQKKARRQTGLGPVRTIPRGARFVPTQAVALVKAVENNYVDLALAAHAADTTGEIFLVATIAQGATVNQRIGKKAMYKSVQVRGYASNSSTATYNRVSWMLIYDRRPTGALPVITDVLAAADSTAFPNDANTGRFKTLCRRDFTMVSVPAAAAGTDCSAVVIDEYVKVPKKVIFKAAGTGAIADIEEGAIYCITVGHNAPGTTAANIALAFRTRFHE